MQYKVFKFDHVSIGGGLIGTLSTIEIIEKILNNIYRNQNRVKILKNFSLNFCIIDKNSNNFLGGIAYGFENSKFGYFNNPYRLLNIEFQIWLKQIKNKKKIINYLEKFGGYSGKKWLLLNKDKLLDNNYDISEIYFPRYSLAMWLKEKFSLLNKKILSLKKTFKIKINVYFLEVEILKINKKDSLFEISAKNNIKKINLKIQKNNEVKFHKETIKIKKIIGSYCTLGLGLFPTRKLDTQVINSNNKNYIQDFYETGSTSNLIFILSKLKKNYIRIGFIGAKAGLLEALPELYNLNQKKNISLSTFSTTGTFIKKANLSRFSKDIKLEYFINLKKINTAKKIFDILKKEFQNSKKLNFNEYDIWTKILKENIIDRILKSLPKKEIESFNLFYHDKIREITRFTYPETVEILNQLIKSNKIKIIKDKVLKINIYKNKILVNTNKENHKFDIVINVSGPTNLYDKKYHNDLLFNLKGLQKNHEQAFNVAKNFQFTGVQNLYSPGAISLGFNPKRKTIIKAITNNVKKSSSSICKKIMSHHNIIKKKYYKNSYENYIYSGGIYAPKIFIQNLKNNKNNLKFINHKNKLLLSFDGDTGSGKTVISKYIAKKLNLIHIDSGYFFKALALDLIRNNINFSYKNKNEILNSLKKIQFAHLSNNKLNQEVFSKYASILSKFKFIRKPFLKKFSEFIKSIDNLSVTGRDIGSKILSNNTHSINFFLNVSEKNSIKRKSNKLEYNISDAKLRFVRDKKITIMPKKSIVINTDNTKLSLLKKSILMTILEKN